MNTTGDFKSGDDSRRNSKGRPRAGKSIAEYTRRKTKNGRALIDFYCKVFENETEDTENRLRAAQRLEDRGFGKPTQPIGDDGEGLRIIWDRPIESANVQHGLEDELRAGDRSVHFGNGNGNGA